MKINKKYIYINIIMEAVVIGGIALAGLAINKFKRRKHLPLTVPIEDQMTQYPYINSNENKCETFTNVDSVSGYQDFNTEQALKKSMLTDFSRCENDRRDHATFPNFVKHNDERPLCDAVNNNFIPQGNVKQDMRGTGVEQIGVYYDENDRSSEQLNLYAFTGCDPQHLNKRETGPMFAPDEGNVSWIHGQPVIHPDEDRYTMSIRYKQNEKPCESIRVGPGIGLDADIPAEGGFQQFTRCMPDNTDGYRCHQFAGRASGSAQWQVSSKPEARRPVDKNLPNDYYTIADYPLCPNAFYVPQATQRPIYELKYTNRSVQGDGFGGQSLTAAGGPAIKDVPIQSTFSDTYKDTSHNIKSLCDTNYLDPNQYFAPSRGGQQQSLQDGWFCNETGRGELSQTTECQINFKGPGMITNRENFTSDLPNTTTKETAQLENYCGGAIGTGMITNRENFMSDLPNTTTRETTQLENFVGGATGITQQSIRSTFTKDPPKTTIKETSNFDWMGCGPSRGGFQESSRNAYIGGSLTATNRASSTTAHVVPGRSNLRDDAEQIMGKTLFCSDVNPTGSGTFNAAIPNATNQQNDYIIGNVQPNANKIMCQDNRSIDKCQVEQLLENPLSIFATKEAREKNEIPSLFCDMEPNNFTTYKYKDVDEKIDFDTQNMSVLRGTGDCYTNMMGFGTNVCIKDNKITEEGKIQVPQINSPPEIVGKCYSDSMKGVKTWKDPPYDGNLEALKFACPAETCVVNLDTLPDNSSKIKYNYSPSS